MRSYHNMASISIQTSALRYSLCSKRVNAAIRVPKHTRVDLSVSGPRIAARTTSTRDLVEDLNFTDSVPSFIANNVTATKKPPHHVLHNHSTTSKLYAILEAVADRAEMHKNVCEQRDNWNALLLNNINMITLTAATFAGVAAAASGVEGSDSPILALKLSSTLLFSVATGMLLVMNKLQPSQLAEEQRKATRCFRQLQTQIEHTLALGNPSEEDVKAWIEKVLAIDRAYPLPLLGVMLEKLPKKYEPAVWWPSSPHQKKSKKEGRSKTKMMEKRNGWSEELETELREVIEVVKRKDVEDYERLGNIALKMNKRLAIAGPLLTAIAAVGAAFVGSSSWAGVVATMAGSMGAVVNAFEHGGQVGMVFEMYRNCGGFFKQLEQTVEATLEETDLDTRENGELFEMKMALQLGTSVSQLRELASKSASCRAQGIAIDECASKLY